MSEDKVIALKNPGMPAPVALLRRAAADGPVWVELAHSWFPLADVDQGPKPIPVCVGRQLDGVGPRLSVSNGVVLSPAKLPQGDLALDSSTRHTPLFVR